MAAWSSAKFGETHFSDVLKNPQILTFFFAIFAVIISLTTHELWQDEMEAPSRIHRYGWNLWALMESFRGDGHFPLYHVLLYPIFNLSHRVLGLDCSIAVKFFTFLQFVLLAYLAIKWVRFPYSVLFLSSYYVIYEFGTISRCYLLALILLLVIWKNIVFKDKENDFLTVLACFCFPLTQLFSLIFSCSLLFYYVIKKSWLRVVAFTASFSIAAYYLYPRYDYNYYYVATTLPSIDQFIRTFFRFLISAWAPFTTSQLWWNQSFISEPSSVNFLLTLLLIVLIISTLVKLYIFEPLLTVACCVGSLLGVGLLTVKYPSGAFRHTGYAAWPFLCLLNLFLSKSSLNIKVSAGALKSGSLFLRSFISIFLIYLCLGVLVFHSFFGLVAIYKDFNSVFSFSSAQAKNLDNLLNIFPESELFDYPGEGSLAVSALSNWKHNPLPIWKLANRNCLVSANNTKSNTADSSHELPCPRVIIVTTWSMPLEGLSPDGDALSESTNESFLDFLHQRFFGQSVGHFLTERAFHCKQVAFFPRGQTVELYTYQCFR